MSRSVTVLGGAAAGGNPGQGCSGYLVEAGSTCIVLDLGAGTLPQLRLRRDPRELTAIVISHMHLDHVLDLLALRYFLAYAPTRSPRKIPLWLPPGGRALLDGLSQALAADGEGAPYFDTVFAIETYDPDRHLEIEPLTIAFAPTVHYAPCWAMRVTDRASGASLGYTADTGPSANLAALTSGCAVLIAEASLSEPGDEPWASRGHLTPEEAAALATASGAKTLVLTHRWAEHEPDRLVARAQEVTNARVIGAEPGLTIAW